MQTITEGIKPSGEGGAAGNVTTYKGMDDIKAHQDKAEKVSYFVYLNRRQFACLGNRQVFSMYLVFRRVIELVANFNRQM